MSSGGLLRIVPRPRNVQGAPQLPAGLGIPVDYVSNLAPWASPQRIPTGPGNLPPNANRPPLRVFDNGALPLIDTGPGDTPALPFAVAPDSTDVTDRWHAANPIEGFIAVVSVANDLSQLFINQPAGKRNYLLLRNTTATGNVAISFGNPASVNSPLVLQPGQMILFDEVVPQGDVYAFATAAATSLAFAYSNIP